MKLLRQFIRMQIYFVLITIAFASVASAKNDLNLLARRYPLDRLKKIILPKNEWHPYPTVYHRDVWLTVPANVRNAHIARGEELLNYQWKSFPATVFLEFVRTGEQLKPLDQL